MADEPAENSEPRSVHIGSLSAMSRPQIAAIIEKAVVKGRGVYEDPALDLDAIKERSESLDPTDPIKADIYLLIKTIRSLSK